MKKLELIKDDIIINFNQYLEIINDVEKAKKNVKECNEEFGYKKIVVERPELGEDGRLILKKGKPVADASRRDTENVPFNVDTDEYFAREIIPYAPDAWIDTKKTKIGYEIPMTRYFYEYQAPEKVEDIMTRLNDLESDIQASLNALFGGSNE